MKTNRLFIGLCLIVLGGASPMMGQSKKEKQQKKEKAVSLAIEARKYKIDVNRATPMKGGSKYLTSPYSIEVRNDSLYSYLPYFGVAYNIPYGGGKGLNFKESISEYTTEHEKKERQESLSNFAMMKTVMCTTLPFTPTGQAIYR